jgi:hypothetical protein
MIDMGVCVSVGPGYGSARLHDEWLRLFRLCSAVGEAAGVMFREWKDATPDGTRESAESARLWREYSVFQSEYRVLCAWRDVLHAAWVFSTDGRECRFLTGELSGVDDALAGVS